MNERIQKLAQQAGFQSYITTHEEDVAMFEKFAELLVRECAQVIKDCEKYGHDKPLEFEVMEHFGVEE